MIDAAERANVRLIVGHSHSSDAPTLCAREIIAGGALGAVRMINARYYTDFMYRPRRAEELVTARRGGAVFSQAAHQVDIVRLLGGGSVHSGRWAMATLEVCLAMLQSAREKRDVVLDHQIGLPSS
jgi:phthalate 4,5-cis-dihydrodiol dehydrogenase